jgi:hypothetical protein
MNAGFRRPPGGAYIPLQLLLLPYLFTPQQHKLLLTICQWADS